MNKNNIFYLPVPEEVRDYLQRLDYEVSARVFVIDRILTSHKDDADASVIEGIPFQTYQKQLEEKNSEYAMAKNKFTNQLKPLVQKHTGKEEVSFTWTIEDFSELQAKIILGQGENIEEI